MKKILGVLSIVLLVCFVCCCCNNTSSQPTMPTDGVSSIAPTPFPEYVYNGKVVLLDSMEDYPKIDFDSNNLKEGVKFNVEFDALDYSKVSLYVKIKQLRINQAVDFYVNGTKVFTLTRNNAGTTHDITNAILPALHIGENTLSAAIPSVASFEGVMTLYSNGYLLSDSLDITGASSGEVPTGLYGMNMEITRSAWHYGLSAQMLNNRKFFSGADGKPAGWNGNNFKYITDNISKSMCQSNYVVLEKDGTISHQDEWIHLDKGQSYEIKVWTNSDVRKQTKLEIYINDKKITTFTVKKSSGAYNEYSFIYKAEENIENGTFTIKNKTASIDIFQVSMMNTNNYMGMRIDVIEALKQLKPTTLRYAGGCCADKWDWKESIKEAHLRKPMNAYGMEGFLFTSTYDQDPFDFGLLEFMALCKAVGAKAEITLSLVSMDAQSSGDLVEYCQDNGYEVLNWYVGNEVYFFGGEYAVDGVLAAQKTNHFIREMRKVDPNINVVVGIHPIGDCVTWSEIFVKNVTEKYEYLSVHNYFGPSEVIEGHFNGLADLNALGAFQSSYNPHIKESADFIERLEKYIPEGASIYIDEWNWGFNMMPSTLMFLGDCLYWHTLVNSSVIYPAYSASFFHPLEGMIVVTPNEAKITAAGTAFQLFVKHKNQTILDSYNSNKSLSILATQGAENSIISIANREQAAVRLTVNSEINGEQYSKVKIYTIEAIELDLNNTALVEAGTVKIYQSEKEITEDSFTLDIPGVSLVVVELLK